MFNLLGWNPGGVSLSYRPQTVSFPSMGTGTGTDVTDPTGKMMPVETKKPLFGQWDPRSGTVPTLGKNPNAMEGLDKLMQLTGMLGQMKGGPGLPIDPKQASAMAALAKGKGTDAGLFGDKKMNEAAIASLLSLGSAGIGNVDKRKNAGTGNAVTGILGFVGAKPKGSPKGSKKKS